MKKENAPDRKATERKGDDNSSAESTDNEAFRQKLIKNLFSKKSLACFECGAKLSNSNRKRIVASDTTPEGIVFSGYQLCKPCAVLMQAGELQKLPKIQRDIAVGRFEFMGADVECVGSRQ